LKGDGALRGRYTLPITRRARALRVCGQTRRHALENSPIARLVELFVTLFSPR
jgi:hypothetical protein